MAKKKRIFYLAYLVLVLLAGSYILFNEYGVIRLMKLKKEAATLRQDISKVELQNNLIQSSIDSLQKKIPEKIEEVARNKYNMKKENEKMYEVKVKE